MKKETQMLSPYEKAQARVKELKQFYKHLVTYILVNVVLLAFSGRITFILLGKGALGNPEFLEWVNWNILGTPIIWGIGLLIHAIVVFKPNLFKFSFFKRWEERKIKEFIEQDKKKEY